MSIRDYKITDAQIAEKGVIASPDTLTGTADENKRVFDRLVRECVAPQFNEIVETFADMEESTTEWSGEEAKRQQAEQGRVSAETARVSAEDDRAQAESARVSAETARQQTESARDTAETARANAENKRDSAEKSRVSAENARNVWQKYDAAKTYVPGNKVSFGGSSYLCTAATVGHEPTDTAYWLLIAQKGADGAGADDLRRINDALDAIDPTKVSAKAAPADGDGVMIADSADGSKAKRLLWSSVKEALGKLFVPLTRKVNGKTLTEDVTLTGENIAVSTADSTPISGAVKYRTNPNLLDNWYFGNPVNQRKGKIIPAGKSYYTTPDITLTEVGKTDKAYTVIEIQNYTGYGQRATISIDGTVYYVRDQDAVRGYTGLTYSVDRWISPNSCILVDGGLLITASASGQIFMQRFPQEMQTALSGKTVTFSVLATIKSGVFYLTDTNGFSASHADVEMQTGVTSWTFPVANFNSISSLGWWGDRSGAQILVHAAKLELGDTQTLAHKENGVWILNEVPDYREQLSRCEFYRRVSAIGHFFPGSIYSDSNGVFLFPFSGGMRVTPSIEIVAPGFLRDSSGASRGLSADNYLIEAVDQFGAKIVLHELSGVPIGPANIADAKFALSADL